MRRLIVFNTVSLDGYFTGTNGDLGWAHNPRGDDTEWQAFVDSNAKGSGMLLFGRVTYEMMVSFWPTPAAREQFPVVARGMNESPKVVFSRTMQKATWSNTTLVKDGLVAEVRKLKGLSGKDLVILGSGSIVSQLAQERLVDEYQIVFYPIVLGQGRTMFDGVTAGAEAHPDADLRQRERARLLRTGSLTACLTLGRRVPLRLLSRVAVQAVHDRAAAVERRSGGMSSVMPMMTPSTLASVVEQVHGDPLDGGVREEVDGRRGS